MVNEFQSQALSTRLGIPIIYGVDAVHGHGNVYGATVFPHNIGLGATRDPALVEQIGQATAAEVRATGIPWNFSPCVCVARDERWGRTYESFGEDPALVSRMATIIDGLQGARARAIARRPRAGHREALCRRRRHGVRRGDRRGPTSASRGSSSGTRSTRASRWPPARTSRRSTSTPYRLAIRRHGVRSVMPSFSSVDWTEDGVGNPLKMHAHDELITDVLKGQIALRRLRDLGLGGHPPDPGPGQPGYGGLTPYKVRVGVNAGTDMFMEPNSRAAVRELLLAEVKAGRVSKERIDDAVRRILQAKFELGLFEHRSPRPTTWTRSAAQQHRALARQAVAESQVLLKNDGDVLPLAADADIYVAGRNADNIGNQAGGWTIAWQGISGDIIPGTTILEGIREVAPRRDGHVQRGRVGADGRAGRGHRRGRRDAVCRGLRRRGRTGVRLLLARAAGGEVAVPPARRPGGHR